MLQQFLHCSNSFISESCIHCTPVIFWLEKIRTAFNSQGRDSIASFWLLDSPLEFHLLCREGVHPEFRRRKKTKTVEMLTLKRISTRWWEFWDMTESEFYPAGCMKIACDERNAHPSASLRSRIHDCGKRMLYSEKEIGGPWAHLEPWHLNEGYRQGDAFCCLIRAEQMSFASRHIHLLFVHINFSTPFGF